MYLDTQYFFPTQYLISETDRLVNSILNTLEIVSTKQCNADMGHIFINFIYNLSVMYEDVFEAILGFIKCHGKRLWRLHITGLEICIVLKDSEGNVTLLHCIIKNVSGLSSITTATRRS